MFTHNNSPSSNLIRNCKFAVTIILCGCVVSDVSDDSLLYTNLDGSDSFYIYNSNHEENLTIEDLFAPEYRNSITSPVRARLNAENISIKTVRPVLDFNEISKLLADSLVVLERMISQAGSITTHVDGFVLLDDRNPQVVTYSWIDGKIEILGGVGQGPGEYMRPRGVTSSQRGDTIAIYDGSMFRYSIFVNGSIDTTLASERISFVDMIWNNGSIIVNAPDINKPKLSNVPYLLDSERYDSDLSDIFENSPFPGPSVVATLVNNSCILAEIKSGITACFHTEMNNISIYESDNLKKLFDIEIVGSAIDTLFNAYYDDVLKRRQENEIQYTHHGMSVVKDVFVTDDYIYVMTVLPEIIKFDKHFNQVAAFRVAWGKYDGIDYGVYPKSFLGMPYENLMIFVSQGNNRIFGLYLE